MCVAAQPNTDSECIDHQKETLYEETNLMHGEVNCDLMHVMHGDGQTLCLTD